MTLFEAEEKVKELYGCISEEYKEAIETLKNYALDNYLVHAEEESRNIIANGDVIEENSYKKGREDMFLKACCVFEDRINDLKHRFDSPNHRYLSTGWEMSLFVKTLRERCNVEKTRDDDADMYAQGINVELYKSGRQDATKSILDFLKDEVCWDSYWEFDSDKLVENVKDYCGSDFVND